MDNMELILKELRAINGRLDTLETKVDSLQDDMGEIKEYTEITRDGVNTLLGWADSAARVINVPLKSSQE